MRVQKLHIQWRDEIWEKSEEPDDWQGGGVEKGKGWGGIMI